MGKKTQFDVKTNEESGERSRNYTLSPCSRRKFVKLGAGACAGASLLSGCASVGVYRGQVTNNKIPLDLPTFQELAGGRNAIFVEVFQLDAPLILMKNEDGFQAVSAKCTHQACIVTPEKSQIACSCHGSRFSRKGEVTHGPAAASLPEFPVKVEGDKIQIEIP